MARLLAIFLAVVVWGCRENEPASTGRTGAELRPLVSMGMTASEVEALLGPPNHTQSLESGRFRVEYRYFGTDNALQVGITDGQVVSINQF